MRNTCSDSDLLCWDNFYSTCKFTPGEVFYAGGRQDIVSPSLKNCDTGPPCSTEVSYTMTDSVEISSSEEHGSTNTSGIDLSSTIGASFPITATVTVGASFSFAKSVSSSTSQSHSQSNATSITDSMGSHPGSQALLTFTPSMECYEVTVQCPNSQKRMVNSCSPNMKDGRVIGEYLQLYVG